MGDSRLEELTGAQLSWESVSSLHCIAVWVNGNPALVLRAVVGLLLPFPGMFSTVISDLGACTSTSYWWRSWQSAGLGFRRPEFWSNSATGCWGNSIKSPFFSVSCFSLKKRWAIQRTVRIWRCSLRKLVCECLSRPEPQLHCLSWIHEYIPRLEVMLFSSNINHTSIPSPLQCRQPRYLKIAQISLHKICSAEFTQPLCLSKGCKKQLCSSKFLNSSSCLTREI